MTSGGFQELPEAIRRLPDDWAAGNREMLEALMPSVYDELRRLAHHQLRRERPGHTLQTTALVHEVYLRLLEQRNLGPEDRTRLLAVAARLMRYILVDYARRRRSVKHGGVARHVSIDAALERLSAVDARKLHVVELRLFGGLDVREIAEAIGVSVITVERDWRFARGWLERELRGAP